jgi:hypothetical protein
MDILEDKVKIFYMTVQRYENLWNKIHIFRLKISEVFPMGSIPGRFSYTAISQI